MNWGSRSIIRMGNGEGVIENMNVTQEEGKIYEDVTIHLGEMSLCVHRKESEICKLEHYLAAESTYLDHVTIYGKTTYTELIKGTLVAARKFAGLELEDKLK